MKRDLDNPANCLCLNMRKAARTLTRSYDAALAPCGLTTGQFATLLTLQQMGPATISAIARMMDLERSALTRNLAVMERNGLIARTAGEDRREKIISLSAKGQSCLKDSLPLWQKAQSATISRLGEEASQKVLTSLAGIE